MAGARSLWIVATLLTWGTAAWAQSPVAVNPRAFEFEFPAVERSENRRVLGRGVPERIGSDIRNGREDDLSRRR